MVARKRLIVKLYLYCLSCSDYPNWPTISYPIFQSFQNLRCRVSSETLALSQTDMKSRSLNKTLPKYTTVMSQVRQYDVKLGLNIAGGLNKRGRRMPATLGGGEIKKGWRKSYDKKHNKCCFSYNFNIISIHLPETKNTLWHVEGIGI